MTATTAGERVGLALLRLADAAQDLNVSAASVDSMTVEEAAQALTDLRGMIAPLRQVEAGLESWIARCFRAEGWDLCRELPGIGMVEVRRSTTRRAWDHEGLRSRWLGAYMDSIGGEAVDPGVVRDALFDVLSVSGWKVTGLRALGIAADDYCSSEPGTPRVVIA